MTIMEEELNIIHRVRTDMFKAIDKDGVNKVYRQARIWTRYHHFLANACSYEKYRFLNNTFKMTRKEAINALR